MAKTILIIGTLDTKAKELAYLRERIEAEGVKSLLMDIGCKSETVRTICPMSPAIRSQKKAARLLVKSCSWTKFRR